MKSESASDSQMGVQPPLDTESVSKALRPPLTLDTRPITDTIQSSRQRLLLDLILENKKETIQILLKDHGIPISGTKDQIRDRLDSALNGGSLAVPHVVSWLNRVQGWGNQHLYFFQVPENLMKILSDKALFLEDLRGTGLESLLAAEDLLLVPEDLKFVSIAHGGGRLRCVLVSRRVWYEASEYEFNEDGRTRHEKRRTGRAVYWVGVNLLTGIAVFSVPQLERGDRHDKELTALKTTLKAAFDVDQFTPIDPAPSIPKLRELKEVRGRRYAIESEEGVIFEAATRSRTENLFSYRKMDSAFSRVGRNIQHHGDFYLSLPEEDTELHFRIHADDKRLYILGQWGEEAVRDVIDLVLKNLE